MSEFNDRPFVAGSLIGERAFKVDQYGRLTGVYHTEIFRPGENVGECLREIAPSSAADPYRLMLTHLTFPSFTFDTRTQAERRESERKAELERAAKQAERRESDRRNGHRTGQLDCQCGYYAYFDGGANQYLGDDAAHGPVFALIEGYGVVTVGQRGFRAEKAKLAAIVIRAKQAGKPQFEAIRTNYPDVPVFERRSEARAAFPYSPPPLPSPQSHGSDFWAKKELSA